MKVTSVKRKVVNATKKLILSITEENVKQAKCSDPNQCVIAQALHNHFGPVVEGFQVGASITKVITGDKLIRYTTSAKLRNALITFDKTKHWKLPPGEYNLNPMHAGYVSHRWDKKKKKKTGTQSTFKGKALPTRKALTACQLVK